MVHGGGRDGTSIATAVRHNGCARSAALFIIRADGRSSELLYNNKGSVFLGLLKVDIIRGDLGNGRVSFLHEFSMHNHTA